MIFTERIKQQQTELKFGLAVKNLVATPGYVLGWAIGKAWWLCRFVVASFILGFRDGEK